ncbi:hypothetical protein GW950_00210 [Candidatus Wolfebacteria bacterium]|nr:hypothetical protein [Candidatus Wolfebacteria bacterium]
MGNKMDLNPDIKEFLEKLSSRVESDKEKNISSTIPQNKYKENDVLFFLTQTYKFFEHSFCYRPKMSILVRSVTRGDYLVLFLFIKESDIAYEISLLRTELPPNDYNFF